MLKCLVYNYRVLANSTDARFANSDKIMNEIDNIVKNPHMNATVDPNKPKTKLDFTRLRTYCKKLGHTIKFCLSQKKKKKFTMEKAPHQPKETTSQKEPNQQNLPNLYRLNSNDHSIAQKCRSDNSYVANRNRSRSNNYFGTVRSEVRPDKFNSLYDTLLSLRPLNKSILRTMEVRNQITAHTSRAGRRGQQLLFELLDYAVGDTNKNDGLSTQFFSGTGARSSLINCDTFSEIEKIQTLFVMPLEKSPLAAN